MFANLVWFSWIEPRGVFGCGFHLQTYIHMVFSCICVDLCVYHQTKVWVRHPPRTLTHTQNIMHVGFHQFHPYHFSSTVFFHYNRINHCSATQLWLVISTCVFSIFFWLVVLLVFNFESTIPGCDDLIAKLLWRSRN